MVEHQLPKLRAAGSNPVFRSRKPTDDENHPFFCIRTEPMQARLQKEPDGYKKGGAPAHPVFLKAPLRRGGREWRSPNPAEAEGMHRPQGEHNPAEAEGMAEPQSRRGGEGMLWERYPKDFIHSFQQIEDCAIALQHKIKHQFMVIVFCKP